MIELWAGVALMLWGALAGVVGILLFRYIRARRFRHAYIAETRPQEEDTIFSVTRGAATAVACQQDGVETHDFVHRRSGRYCLEHSEGMK